MHDAGILPDDRPYLVLELCPGGSLSAWLAPEKRPPERVRDVGVRIADALAAAHARGVIHRDVKPANILIDAYGNAGLTDFGLAAMPEPGSELSVTMEALTPAYAPPEVFVPAAGDRVRRRLLAGGHPLRAAGRPSAALADRGHTPTLPEMFELHGAGGGCPTSPQLMDVLVAGLAAEASERPTAAQFRDQLAAVELGPDATVDRRALALTGCRFRVRRVSSPALHGRGGRRPASPRRAGHGTLRRRDRRRPVRRRPGTGSAGRTLFPAVLIVIVALLAAGIVYVSVTSRQQIRACRLERCRDRGDRRPSPGAPARPVPVGGLPSPELLDGFVDCSELGKGALCPDEPECWGGLQTFADVPVVATPIDCNHPHPFQTFVAVQLPPAPHAVPAGEGSPMSAVHEGGAEQAAVDGGPAPWQIQPIPYKVFPTPDNLSRCLVSTGVERTAPLPMKAP